MTELWLWVLHYRTYLIYPLGLVLAASVTCHVLLRKQNVVSSSAWIGLSWFAPITGALLYFMFGINRVQRRARRLRGEDRSGGGKSDRPIFADDDHLDALEQGIRRITGDPAVRGNAIEVFNDGDEGYPPMLAAIAAAQHSVAMSSYIFRADEWGSRFIDALAEAHARGVQVRVLVDGIGGGWLKSAAYHALRKRDVPAARFLHSPLPWRMPFLNLRSHKKILIVDGAIGFTGGLNIADENVMATHPAAPVQDTHFRAEGPVVGQMMDAFVQDWSFATDEDLEGSAWYPQLDDRGEATARMIDSGPDNDIEEIELAILQAIACARTSVEVMTPYFLPDERMMTTLALAAMRGVSVDIVIPETSDHRFVDWASRGNSGPILTDGVRMWLCPPPFRHSKVMVVDGEWSLFGSCNWDMRSFRLNFELCMEVYNRPLAADLSALMRRSRGKALTSAEIDSRSTVMKLRDAATRLLLPYL